jgi:hypothetical protein
MHALLEDPLHPRLAWLAALAVVLGGGLYCFFYSLLAGSPERLSEGILWALVNLLPWLVAFEMAKRLNYDPSGTWALNRVRIAAVLAAAAAASVGLELLSSRLTGVAGDPMAFAFVRRLPGAALVVVLLLVVPRLRRGGDATPPVAVKEVEASSLPLLPHQIDWIKAAGNYLEIRASGRLVLQRMTMAAAEELLGGHGFVRIHRSALINRARIVRHVKGKVADEVLLADGTRLKVGGAYRARANGAAATRPA